MGLARVPAGPQGRLATINPEPLAFKFELACELQLTFIIICIEMERGAEQISHRAASRVAGLLKEKDSRPETSCPWLPLFIWLTQSPAGRPRRREE